MTTITDNYDSVRLGRHEPDEEPELAAEPAPPEPLGCRTRPQRRPVPPAQVAVEFEDIALAAQRPQPKVYHVLISKKRSRPAPASPALAEPAFALDATSEHDGIEFHWGTADTTDADCPLRVRPDSETAPQRF